MKKFNALLKYISLGPNCLKGLSADDIVMKKFNAFLKYISLGPNCLKGLSADDNVG